MAEGDEQLAWCGGGGLLVAAGGPPDSQARLPSSKGSPHGGTGDGVLPTAGAPDSRSRKRGGGPICTTRGHPILSYSGPLGSSEVQDWTQCGLQ